MKSVLEELYFADDGMCERVGNGKEYRNLNNKFCTVFDRLVEKLNKEQEKMLNELIELTSGLEAESALAYFKEGFKLCVQLMLESLGDLKS